MAQVVQAHPGLVSGDAAVIGVKEGRVASGSVRVRSTVPCGSLSASLETYVDLGSMESSINVLGAVRCRSSKP